jgi:hypothetical protein
LHTGRNFYILHFHPFNHNAPRLSDFIDNFLDFDINLVAVLQNVVEDVLPNDIA